MKIILPIIMSRLLVMFEVIILNDECIMWSLTGSSRLKEFLDRLIVSRRWLFHFYVRCTDSNLCSGWWALFPSHYIILLVRWYVILLRIKKEKNTNYPLNYRSWPNYTRTTKTRHSSPPNLQTEQLTPPQSMVVLVVHSSPASNSFNKKNR